MGRPGRVGLVGREGLMGRVGMEGWIWRAGWCPEWLAGTDWCRQGVGGGGRPGGAEWGLLEELTAVRYGPGRVHRVVPAVNVPINGSAGLCVRSEWSHGKKLAIVLDILPQF